MAVNLRDIAKKLDLSVATVSRALSNHGSVNPATRALVLKSATEMGYRQLTPRNNKEQSKQLSILALVHVLGGELPEPNSMHALILAGMSEAAIHLDASLQIHYIRSKDLSELLNPENQPAGMKRGEIDGLILISVYDQAVTEKLAKMFPCVLVHGYHRELKLDYVGANNAEAISKMVERFYNLGHRKIGLVTYDTDKSWLRERQGGYLEAMHNLGLSVDPEAIISAKRLDQSSENLDLDDMERKINEGTRAWITVSDGVGYKVYKNLLDRGIRVPEDTSLSGFDAAVKPNDCKLLTSAKEPCEDVGNEAVRRLVHRIRFPLTAASKVLYACEIIKGETESAYVSRPG